jgi:multidrug transporter EmrE-like cation transporter
LSYVMILVASGLLFGESFSVQRLGGILLICLGVIFIFRGGRI